MASPIDEVITREYLRVNSWKYIQMSDAQVEVVIITARALHSEGRLFTSRAYDPKTGEGPYPAAEHDECALLWPCGLCSKADPYLDPVHEDPVCSPCSPRSPSPDTRAEDTTSEPTKREAMLKKLVALRLVSKDSGGNRCKQ